MKQRLNYIDIAKGIGIIMVVVGHCSGLPTTLNRLIFSVHMPLFFILSGYFFNPESAGDEKAFLKKNAKGLLLPYALTCVFVIGLRVLRTIISGGDIFFTFRLWFFASIYGSGTIVPSFFAEHGIPMRIIGAIWFLLALFVGKALLMYITKTSFPLLFAAAVSYIGYSTTNQFWLPFSLQAGLNCVIFLYIGYFIRRNNLFEAKTFSLPIRLLMAATWIFCIFYGGRLYMVRNFYGNGLLDIIGAVCGTFVIVSLSRSIERHIPLLSRTLYSIGRISLGIMCAHLIAINCWPVGEISLLLQSFLPLPKWIISILNVSFASALVTVTLYFFPVINRFFFPGAKILMFYKKCFTKS